MSDGNSDGEETAIVSSAPGEATGAVPPALTPGAARPGATALGAVAGFGGVLPNPGGNSDWGASCPKAGSARASAAAPAASATNLMRRRIRHRLLDMRNGHRAIERRQRQHRADNDNKKDQENQDRARQLGILQEIVRAALLPDRRRLCIAPAAMSAVSAHQREATNRPIVLIGLMGVGKSTVGRRLANRLHLPFADSDHEIEQAAGLTISEMFEKYGEGEFRDGERRVIARLIDGSPKVIATGGGAFMNEQTRNLILERATAIWLDADVHVLAERVGRRAGTRPLLNGTDPQEKLAALAEARNPIYALAPIHIRSRPLPHEATVEEILQALDR